MTINNQANNKKLILKQHAEIWSKGNIALCDEMYTEDFICHFWGGPDWFGPQGVKERVANIRRAFPDWREEVEDIIAEDDKVATRFTSYHMGEFQGIPATSKQVAVGEVAIFRISEGKIAEQWVFHDIAGLRAQLQENAKPG
jgi:steroid delta-isomerase-like uncharacterized protein